MKNINEIMLHPVRMRIIQALSTQETTTSNDLCEKISDIPRTTLYRHIKLLIDHKLITVVSEEKIRGSVERTIALNVPEITKHNTIEDAAYNAFGFLMSNYSKFHQYFHGSDPNPNKDKIFLNNTVLMMSDEEFDQFLIEMRELLLKFNFEVKEERKARDLSIISAPVYR